MKQKERARRRWENNQRKKKQMERMARTCKSYPCPAEIVDQKYVDGELINLDKPYVKKIYKSSNANRFSYFKRYSNKAVRRYLKQSYIRSGNSYRKVFDYQWEIY